MNNALKILAVISAALIPFAMVASASGAGEKVTAKTKITPNGGKLFKKKRVPSRLFVNAVVKPSASSSKVNPTKRIKLTFPRGMDLRPNRRVCPDSKLNPNSALGNPKRVINSCRGAVVGTGTAMIYLAQNKSAPLRDPILVAFNAGKTRNGAPKLKIYGYSQATTVGILMTAALKGRVLNLHIPVLSYDSAVGTFRLGLPGARLKRPELGVNVKGLNRRYVYASCPSSPLVTSSVFALGSRDASTGNPTSPTTTVRSKRTFQKCVGKANRR